MRKVIVIAFALAMALTGAANAQTSVTADVTVDTTWGVGANACPIILENPIFVKDGATLTILPGCIVRGQPRTGPVVPGSTVGSPGALIVSRTGRINAIGSETAPIVFTTAAVDADGDDVADGAPGAFTAWTPGATFLDDAPTTDPLSPLNPDGFENVQLWGSVVVLGNAPTNLSDAVACSAGQPGERTIEGLTIPGFSVADSCYGGVDPHDNSGTLSFVSIRHAGDEIGEGNELNCLSTGGVGDGTVISFVECLYNFDDGFEAFGGTHDMDHIVAYGIGDDSIDLDQGYTGVIQFALTVMPHYNENDGDDFGSGSGDTACEWDGDDFDETPSNVNTRALDGVPWPFSNAQVYNMTVIGGIADAGVTNPAADPKTAGSRLCRLRNGFGGDLFNSIVVNGGSADGIQITGGGAAGFDTTSNVSAGLVAVFASTFDDVGAATTTTLAALANGDALVTDFGGLAGLPGANCYNSAVAPASVLVDEDAATLDPDTGRLLTGRPGGVEIMDPRPSPGLCTFGGVNPFAPGTDASATYRGAFQAGQPLWTDGWTGIDQGGLL